MSFDLTNKNIQDTFQNLLQKTGSEGKLFDLVGNEITDLTIGGTLTAHSYITSESIVNTSSGSTAFGNSSDDTHLFTGDITASANISSSGTVYGDELHTTKLVNVDDTDTSVDFSSNQVTLRAGGSSQLIQTATLTNIHTKVQINDPLNVAGHITSSANISASGNLIGNELVIGGGTFTSASLAAGGSGGSADNLGNHTATQDLNLNSNDIVGIQHITTSGDISGSTTSTGSFGKIVGQSSADASVLQSPITAVLNNSVGTVDNGETFAAGTSIESLLRSMLTDFIAPTMNSLTITGLGTRMEVGDIDAVTAGTFTTGSDNNGNGFDSLALTLTNNENSLGTVTSSSLSLDFPDLDVERNVAKFITFTLTGTYSGGSGGTDTATDSISILHPYFFGGNSINGTTGNIASNIDSILADISGSGTATGDVEFNSNTGTYGTQTYINNTSTTALPQMTLTLTSDSANSSNYTYIIYPSSYGDLSEIIQNGADSVIGAFTQLAGSGDSCNHTRFSVTTEYIVYKSNLPGAFTAGDTLRIDD